MRLVSKERWQRRTGSPTASFAVRLIEALSPEIERIPATSEAEQLADLPTISLDLRTVDTTDTATCAYVIKRGVELGTINPDATSSWKAYFDSKTIPRKERVEALQLVLGAAVTEPITDMQDF